jgi:hypothetical protein
MLHEYAPPRYLARICRAKIAPMIDANELDMVGTLWKFLPRG